VRAFRYYSKMSIEIHVLIEALFALPEAAVGEV
jgi:hypothetical protein